MLCSALPGIHHVVNGIAIGTFPGHHPDPTCGLRTRRLQNHVLNMIAELALL